MQRPFHALSLSSLLAYLILITSISYTSLQSTRQLEHRDAFHNNSITGINNQRFKRSYSYERHVEVFVVADHSMSEYHGTNLHHYLLTLMSTVSLSCQSVDMVLCC